MRRHRLTGRVGTAVLAAAILSGCGQAASSSPGAPSATRIPSATPAPSTPTPSAAGGVVVTFLVAGREKYRVLLTDAEDIATARAWQEGSAGPLVPNGHVLYGDDGGVNIGYSWHIDPADIEFAELSIETCDGLPSEVEDGTLGSGRYCPWSAEIISIEPFDS